MIRKFKLEDLNYFEANEHGDARDIDFIFEDPEFHKFTLINDGVKAIICFKETADKDWAGFFLISVDFTPRDGILIKRFIADTVNKYRPNRLWTASHDTETLERWHRFLGLRKEGDPLYIHGKKCWIWSKRWE